jgi:hypothetical protein
MSNHDETPASSPQAANDPGTNEFKCAHTIDLGAYLLGGMSEAESIAMRSHVDGCEWCSVELRSLHPVVDMLDSTELASTIIGERLEPTPDVRTRLFERAHAELRAETENVTPATQLTPATPATVTGSVSSLEEHRNLPRRRSTRTLVAASAIAFSLGAGSVLGVQRLTADSPARPGEKIGFSKISLPGVTPETASNPKTKPRAWVYIEQQRAGTYAWLYVSEFEVGKIYRWWFIKRDGSRVGLGSFKFPGVKPGEEWLRCPGHTALDRSELIAIGATDESGVDVVRQDLPKAPVVVKT